MGEKELVLALRAQGASAAEARDLALVAGALALVPDPEIDAAFADALEARLLSEPVSSSDASPAVTSLRPVPTVLRPAARPTPARRPVAALSPQTTRTIAPVIPLPRRRHTMRKALAVAIAAAMLLALPVAASANALPSSPFYRLKIGIEQLRLHFTPGDVNKGFYDLERAGIRLDEADQENVLGHDDKVVQAMAMMRRSQSHGSALITGGSPSASDLERLRSTLLSYASELATLLPQVDSSARSSVLATLRQGQAIAKTLLGSTAAASIGLPAASDPSAPSVDDTSSTASSGGNAGSPPDSSDVNDPVGGGQKRIKKGVDGGCRVPGSANGLGDLAAPLAQVLCP
jgi:hypothetical protein